MNVVFSPRYTLISEFDAVEKHFKTSTSVEENNLQPKVKKVENGEAAQNTCKTGATNNKSTNKATKLEVYSCLLSTKPTFHLLVGGMIDILRRVEND